MSTSYQTLSAGLLELGLKAMHDRLDGIIDEVNEGRMSFTDGLNELASRERARSRKNRTESIIASAHFANSRTFEQFDFSFQPELRKDGIFHHLLLPLFIASLFLCILFSRLSFNFEVYIVQLFTFLPCFL